MRRARARKGRLARDSALLPQRNSTGDLAPTNYRVREIRFHVVREADAPPRLTLDQPEPVAQLARQLIADDDREHFWIAMLSSQNHLIAWHHVSTGTVDGTLVHARDVLGPALRVLGVRSIILVHNHPSGDPSPSREDMRVTRQLVEGARLVDLQIHDHVIVGNGTTAFTSLKTMGVL